MHSLFNSIIKCDVTKIYVHVETVSTCCFLGLTTGKYAEHVTVILRIGHHMLLATSLCCLSIQVRPV